MNTPKLTGAQLAALQGLYARLRADDSPLTNGPRNETFAGDEREQRLGWARAHLGHPRLSSFSELNAAQAGYLLDVLNGKPSKLDSKIASLWAEAGIPDPAGWLAAIMNRRLLWKFHGKSLREFTFEDKKYLVNLLLTRVRSGKGREPQYTGGCNRITMNAEQNAQWGM